MNFPPNTSINIEALMLALSQQDEPLPDDITQSIAALKDAAFRQGNQEATEQIRTLIRQYPPLEASYNSAYQYLDSQYNAQQRAKALGATFSNPDRLPFIFYNQILPSQDWVSAAKQLTQSRRETEQPEWIRRGNSIVAMISGGAFLGVLLAQLPGAIVGAIVAGIFGWITSKPKTEHG
jgi:hypothetical protein